MKRIITLAIVLAVAVPAVMLAQTPDYYGYDNDTKTVLLEWVEAAIDNNYIDFDTPAYETAFLDLVDDLYAERDVEDWSGCVTVAGYLETAAQYIDGSADKELVISLCDCTEEVYTKTEYLMGITPADQGEIQQALTNDSGGTAQPETVHCVGCEDIWVGSIRIHAVECTRITGVQY